MNTSLYISTGALHSYQQKLDTLSHNAANVNTTGFKKREATFSENLAAEINNQTIRENEVGRLTPHGIREGYGVHLGQTALNLEQGKAQETGQPFDLMIEGKGFFRVEHIDSPGKDGAQKEVRFTRDGSFKMSPTGSGTYYLVTSRRPLA